MAAADQIGVEVPKAIATDNPVYKGVAAALSDLYVVGSPLQEAATKFRTDLGNTVRDISANLGRGDVQIAGNAAKKISWSTIQRLVLYAKVSAGGL